ncbi:hypothetical protein AAF712_015481 [Marasmius tenuissimus]|uniref:Uncharacterized protein n=1 Tax=Marasmius tenuissimus TaxID=585030 RepID=A0ABR2Z9A4_9AGAR
MPTSGATPTTGTITSVSWSREPQEPPEFNFVWIDDSNGIHDTGVRIKVDPTDLTGGIMKVPYPDPGRYHLAVAVFPGNPPFFTKKDQEVKVEPPDGGTVSSSDSSSMMSASTTSNNGTGATLSSSQRDTLMSSPSSGPPGTSTKDPNVTPPAISRIASESSLTHPSNSALASSSSSSASPVNTVTNPQASPTLPLPSGSPEPVAGTASSKSTPGTIAGATIGAVAGTALTLLVLLLLLRRRHRQRRSAPVRDDPETFSRERMIKERDPTSHPASHTSHTSHTREYEAIPTIVVDHSKTNTPTAGLSVPPSRNSSMDDTTTIGDNRDSYIPPPRPGTARTDRQMQIEQKIMELHGQLITLNERARSPDSNASEPRSDTQMSETRERIEKLRGLMNGDWAREVDDEIPAEVLG